MSMRIFVAGHRGMVGSAIVRELAKQANIELLVAPRDELDLLDAAAVSTYMQNYQPDQVYLAAAKVGGIHANNTYPAEFISENLTIQCNVIKGARSAGVKKLLFLGSSCIYPKYASQPISEDKLLTGLLESTNEPYAIAKIAGIKMCESFNRQYGVDYRSVMPTNLYGENDNFHLQNAHVIPAMIQRFHEAKTRGYDKVVIWGTGKPAREFLHVHDMASACVYVMNLDKKTFDSTLLDAMCSHVNVGTGKDVTIAALAQTMARVVGFDGKLEFDVSKLDGTPRKLLSVERLRTLGWQYSIGLEEGLAATYTWFLDNQERLRL